MKNTIAIAIDGPAAAGKSTVAKIVAEKLAYTYIDTGAMYRAFTLEALNKSINMNEEVALKELLETTKIKFKQTANHQLVFLNGEDVTLEIRKENVTNSVSHIAKHRTIREIMVSRQQALAKELNVVMDGRDIGTHVLPEAQLKFFLIASVEERAKRRYEENIKKGFPSNLQQLKKEIEKRDKLDSMRKIAPLIKADDAIEIDTTSLSINDVVAYILEKAEQFIKEQIL